MPQLASGIPKRKRLKIYNKKRIFLTLFVVLLLLTLTIHFTVKMRRVYLRSQVMYEKQASALQGLQDKSKELDDQLKIYDSPVGQERLLRERYNFAKEGEHEIIIEDTSIKTQTPPVKKNSLWTIIKKFLGLYENTPSSNY